MVDRSPQHPAWSVRPYGRAALQRLYRDQSRARRPLSRSLLAPDESLSKRLLFAKLSLFKQFRSLESALRHNASSFWQISSPAILLSVFIRNAVETVVKFDIEHIVLRTRIN